MTDDVERDEMTAHHTWANYFLKKKKKHFCSNSGDVKTRVSGQKLNIGFQLRTQFPLAQRWKESLEKEFEFQKNMSFHFIPVSVERHNT